MKTIEKYLDALDAALDANDRTAIAMLEPFATHLYKEINSRTEDATGDERVAWDRVLLRVKGIISRLVKAGPDLW